MEIISVALKRTLSHKDSMDNKRVIEVVEIQVMSTGTGLTHSEFNDSKTDAVNFIQIWIILEEMRVIPSYERCKFEAINRGSKLQTIEKQKDNFKGEALLINQQVYIYRSDLEVNASLDLIIKTE